MAIEIDNRHQTLMVLWFILLMNLGLLFVISLVVVPLTAGDTTNPVMVMVLTGLGVLFVIASFVGKRWLLAQSVMKQEVRLVQQALIIAFALCEASALLGLVEHLAFGYRQYYFLFLLSAAAFVLHFPRREHLVAASPKIPIENATS